MKITSPTFTENANIPKIYSKLGDNQRPPLEISDVSTGAKSLTIVYHDPDAPGRDGFCHRKIWNLPSKTTEITGESLPHMPSRGLPVGVVLAGTDRNRHLAHTVINFTCTRWTRH